MAWVKIENGWVNISDSDSDKVTIIISDADMDGKSSATVSFSYLDEAPFLQFMVPPTNDINKGVEVVAKKIEALLNGSLQKWDFDKIMIPIVQ